METSKIYIILGLWIAVLSFLGIPGGIKHTLVFLSGLLVAVLPVIFYILTTPTARKRKPRKTTAKKESPLDDDSIVDKPEASV